MTVLTEAEKQGKLEAEAARGLEGAKCLVPNCENHEGQGAGEMIVYRDGLTVKKDWICKPCFDFLFKAQGSFSQLARNALMMFQPPEGEGESDAEHTQSTPPKQGGWGEKGEYLK